MARARKAQQTESLVSKAIIALYLAEPFFAHVVQALARREDASTPTAAVALVGARVELHANPEFFASLNSSARVGVIKHEILHVILKHLLRFQGRDPLLWNLACDVVVNGLIGKWELPTGAIRRSTFPDLPIPVDPTADQVYDLLRSLQHAQAARAASPLSGAALDGLCDADRDRPSGHSDHGAWAGRPGATADDTDAGPGGTGDRGATSAEAGLGAEAAVDAILVRAADRAGPRSWGDLPGHVRAAISAARERGTPKVDWKRVLRLFAAGAGRTRIVGTQRRESARYNTFPGTKIKRFHSLLVAVDTSASIGRAEMDAFFDEIHGIHRSGAKVHVVVCDAAVHEDFVYRGRQPTRVGGGGGTAFEPVFQWMHTQRQHRFDGCIYLTDGFGPAPTTRPPCKVLWVVTDKNGLGDHLTFGRAIHLDLA